MANEYQSDASSSKAKLLRVKAKKEERIVARRGGASSDELAKIDAEIKAIEAEKHQP